MNVFVFPGQGAQYVGMSASLDIAANGFQKYFDLANELVQKDLLEIMTTGDAEVLKQTDVTQPALFIHSVLTFYKHKDELVPDAVAGHSLGEFSALVAANVLSFEDGLKLVYARASAMQEACTLSSGSMAAIIGMEDEVVEQLCRDTDGIIVPANYNCPGQLVVSGEMLAVDAIVVKAKENGAKMAVKLEVGGAFHSPLMQSAEDKLAKAIATTKFNTPNCPIYQNVDGLAYTDIDSIKSNLIKQLTAPVRWTQTMQHMESNGLDHQYEIGGNGKVLTGLLKRYNRKLASSSLK